MIDYKLNLHILLCGAFIIFISFMVSEYTEHSDIETIKVRFYKIYLKLKYIKFKHLFNKTVKIIYTSKKNNILSIDFLNNIYKELEEAWYYINTGYSSIFTYNNINEAILNIRKGTIRYTLVTEKLTNALIEAGKG